MMAEAEPRCCDGSLGDGSSRLVLSSSCDLQLLRVPLDWGRPWLLSGEHHVLRVWLDLHLQLRCNRFPPIASCLLSSLV